MTEQVAKLMKSLGITEEQALEVIASDKEVDRMTPKQLNAELTPEQKKAIKGATKTGTKKTTVYKFDTAKKTKAEDTTKRALMETLRSAVEGYGVESLEVTNPEREMIFFVGGVKYKVVLSAPRT